MVTTSHHQIIPFPQKFLCARDGDLTLRKQSGGLFLVKSGAIYDCDLTDGLPCKTETLNLWVQGPPAQSRTIDKKRTLNFFKVLFCAGDGT